MKNNRLFKSTVARYRKKLKVDFCIMSALFFFFICVVGFIAEGFRDGFTFENSLFTLVIFLILELFFNDDI